MASIRKRINSKGEVTYLVQIRLKGRSPETATFKRKTDADQWAQQTEADKGKKYVPNECKNKWAGFQSGGGVGIGTLVHMAKEQGYKQGSNRPINANISEHNGIRLYHWSELNQLPSRKYLIKGLFDASGLSVIYGASNSGKTFFGLDVACHIGLHMEWQGKKTKGGKVVYIASEGGYGTKDRLEAFRKHRSIEEYGEVYIIPSSVLLAGVTNDLKCLLESLRSLGPLDLVVIDTLARAMGGADENSAKDMGSFIKNCDELRSITGAHVMVIHHPGKDEERGARGSSALNAAIDTEIHISQAGGIITATVKKQRDGKTGEQFCFELQSYKVGTDEDGDALHSCALVNKDALPSRPKLKGRSLQIYHFLQKLIQESGTDLVPHEGKGLQNAVQLKVVKDRYIEAGIFASADIMEE